jgi:uncharacterized tellurite resistance protein B-like protein
MFEPIARLIRDLVDPTSQVTFADDDPRLAVAALLVHAVAVDGRVTAAERATVNRVLGRLYGLDARGAEVLSEAGGRAAAAAVDIGDFVATLARRSTPGARRLVVEALWEAACADGTLHEFEDDMLWRIAGPLGVDGVDRAACEAKARAALVAADAEPSPDGTPTPRPA